MTILWRVSFLDSNDHPDGYYANKRRHAVNRMAESSEDAKQMVRDSYPGAHRLVARAYRKTKTRKGSY